MKTQKISFLLKIIINEDVHSNYSKIYFNYDVNRPKRDLQNDILQVYITI